MVRPIASSCSWSAQGRLGDSGGAAGLISLISRLFSKSKIKSAVLIASYGGRATYVQLHSRFHYKNGLICLLGMSPNGQMGRG